MLRLIKSDAEIKLLRESASLASRAITKVRGCFCVIYIVGNIRYFVSV